MAAPKKRPKTTHTANKKPFKVIDVIVEATEPPAPPITNEPITIDVIVEKPIKREFRVLNHFNELIRIYSVAVHGQNAGELAKMFAKKRGYFIK